MLICALAVCFKSLRLGTYGLGIDGPGDGLEGRVLGLQILTLTTSLVRSIRQMHFVPRVYSAYKFDTSDTTKK